MTVNTSDESIDCEEFQRLSSEAGRIHREKSAAVFLFSSAVEFILGVVAFTALLASPLAIELKILIGATLLFLKIALWALSFESSFQAQTILAYLDGFFEATTKASGGSQLETHQRFLSAYTDMIRSKVIDAKQQVAQITVECAAWVGLGYGLARLWEWVVASAA